MSALETARRLLALGLSVIPVPAPRAGVPEGQPGDGKVPIVPWRDFQARLASDDELVLWFSDEPMNLAVVTGAVSGVVVIDADSDEGRRWCVRRFPYTPWQTKTSRGYHLWYRHPGSLVRNKSKIATPEGRLAIDVRGDGGFVIAPGSQHASGAIYTFAGDWSRPRADVPRFWPGWLQRPATAMAPASVRRRSDDALVTRARAYLAAIPRPEIAAGSDVAVLRAACRLVRGFALPPHVVTSLLWDWCGSREGWTCEWVAQKVQHAQRYGTEPIGGLR